MQYAKAEGAGVGKNSGEQKYFVGKRHSHRKWDGVRLAIQNKTAQMISVIVMSSPDTASVDSCLGLSLMATECGAKFRHVRDGIVDAIFWIRVRVLSLIHI